MNFIRNCFKKNPGSMLINVKKFEVYFIYHIHISYFICICELLHYCRCNQYGFTVVPEAWAHASLGRSLSPVVTSLEAVPIIGHWTDFRPMELLKIFNPFDTRPQHEI